jgi:hypothetical protein
MNKLVVTAVTVALFSTLSTMPANAAERDQSTVVLATGNAKEVHMTAPAPEDDQPAARVHRALI